MLGGDRGVEGVDCVGIVVERLGDDHLCAGACESSQTASCSRARAAASGSARHPDSRQRAAASACGGRTSTRRRGSTIERQPYVGITTDYSGSSAEVAELADAPDSNPVALGSCGFKSHLRHEPKANVREADRWKGSGETGRFPQNSRGRSAGADRSSTFSSDTRLY